MISRHNETSKKRSSRLTQKTTTTSHSLSRVTDAPRTLFELSTEQTDALSTLFSSSGTSILKGITGSGKTEIYFHYIAHIIDQGLQALLMIPEIGLTTQIIERFKESFGFDADVWNSSITKTKKNKIFSRIISGDAKIIIGTRSSLFLPYKNLGLIIVDEEHDAAYKQEDGVLYNARDMAVLRGSICHHPVVLGSATPSIETLYNARLGKYQLVELGSRFGDATLPDIKIIDIKKKENRARVDEELEKATHRGIRAWISVPLENAMNEALRKSEQMMLFLNRKGYAPMMICADCGYILSCKNCSSSMVLHQTKKSLECHHCGYCSAIKYHCHECNNDTLIPYGPGVERIAEEAHAKFPNARIQIVTREEMRTETLAKRILRDIHERKIDIVIGTQIITKGYHFANLTLVGIIDADVGLGGGDLRASERVFQVLYQVSGRAGREKVKGNVYLQTFNPESKFIRMLKSHQFDQFIEDEIESRKINDMPPITRMASILFTGAKEMDVMFFAKKFVSAAKLTDSNIRILGPAPAILSKLQNRYRYRVLLIADRTTDLQAYITYIMQKYKIPSRIHMKIDIDPYSFS